MSQTNLEDPVRETLRNIVDITLDLVNSLHSEGKKAQATELIVWVAECLHGILVQKLRFYQVRPFTPGLVRDRYNAQKAKAGTRVRIKKFDKEE